MKFLVNQPTVISAVPERPVYVEASHASPAIIDIPADYPPSKRWTPLDSQAAYALSKLTGVVVEVSDLPAFPPVGRSVTIKADGSAE